jgi:hypothetical protein
MVISLESPGLTNRGFLSSLGASSAPNQAASRSGF